MMSESAAFVVYGENTITVYVKGDATKMTPLEMPEEYKKGILVGSLPWTPDDDK